MDISIILSAIISIISVVISFLTFFFNIVLPLLKRHKLNVILFKQSPISLFFTTNGTGLKLRFSLDSKNKESTIKEIEAILERTSDNNILKLEWSLLENPFNIWAGSISNSIGSAHFARPIKISANSIEPLVIEFLNYKDSDDFSLIYTKLKQIIYDSTQVKSIRNLDEIDIFVNELENSKEINNLLNRLFDYDFWKIDTYVLTLNILYNNDNLIKTKFTFNIDEDKFISITKHTFIKNTLLDILRNLYNDPTIKYNIENSIRNKVITIYNVKEIK